jgi:antitoxin component of RelBE/YafQ-DinJ toxin-antitoxin module
MTTDFKFVAMAALAVTVSGCSRAGSDLPPEIEAKARESIPRRTYAISTSVPGGRHEAMRVPVLAASPQLAIRTDRDLPEAAADALARIGASAVPEVTRMLNAPEPEQRIRAAGILARIGPDAQPAVPVLITRLHDPDEGVRKAAAHALGQMGPAAADAVPALLEAVAN